VILAPPAQRLFTAMIHDKPLDTSSASPSATSAPTSSKRTEAALNAGHAQTASDACAQVSTSPIIYYEGQYMTPARAYDLSGDVPLSAK
jgi:hypothetical protein